MITVYQTDNDKPQKVYVKGTMELVLKLCKDSYDKDGMLIQNRNEER